MALTNSRKPLQHYSNYGPEEVARRSARGQGVYSAEADLRTTVPVLYRGDNGLWLRVLLVLVTGNAR